MTMTLRHASPHLAVVEHRVSKDGIARELAAIDRRLFCDAEWDAEFGRLVYSVKWHAGPERPPLLITDWREPGTRQPLELSSGLVEKMRRLEAGRGIDKLKLAAEQNAERDARAADDRADVYLDTTREMLPAIKGTRGPVFHRPTTAEGLKAARARARRRDLERKAGLR